MWSQPPASYETVSEEQRRVVFDPKGHMGILSHIDRGVRELTNRVKALAGFREKGSGQASLLELLLETMGSIFLKA